MKHCAPVALIFDGERAVVGGVLVDALVALDLQADLLGRQLDVLGQARAVDLLVVEDVGRGAVLLLGQRRQRGALVGVLGQDAGVGAHAGRVVLVGLAGRGAGVVGRDADRGVARADLRDAGLVEDRQRDRGGAGVELADVADRRLVAARLARVGGRRVGLPARRLRGRVVERDVLDRELAGLGARLLERELGAVDRRHGLRARRALQRQRRVDRQLLAGGLAAASRPSSWRRIVGAASGECRRQDSGREDR